LEKENLTRERIFLKKKRARFDFFGERLFIKNAYTRDERGPVTALEEGTSHDGRWGGKKRNQGLREIVP